MTRRNPDFRGSVRFYSEAEGGRKSPVIQGYRADLAYKKEAFELFMIWPRFLDDKLQEREDGAIVPNPSLADFWIVNEQLKEEVHRRRINPGVIFWVCEGSRKVGEVVVIEILEGLR